MSKPIVDASAQAVHGQPQSYPASAAQKRFWFLHQTSPLPAAYNLPAVARLTGQLNKMALEAALNEIVRRHEVLRTAYSAEGGDLLQKVHPSAFLKLRVIEMVGGLIDSRLQNEIASELARPFDLSLPHPIRATLLRAGPEDHVLILVVHHIAADGWSLGILSWELETLYAAFCSEQKPVVPALSIQYRHFAEWEHKRHASGEMAEGLDFWRKELVGATPLVFDPRNNPESSLRTALITSGSVGQPLVAELKVLCRTQKLTPFMLLFGVFALVLHGITAQPDILAGTPVLMRGTEELERLIGCLLNNVLLRSKVVPNDTVATYLNRIKDVLLRSHPFQHIPFERVTELVRDYSPADSSLAGRSGSNLHQQVQTFFTFQRGSIRLHLPGLICTPIHPPNPAPKVHLFMETWEAPNALCWQATWDKKVISEEQAQEFSKAYARTLGSVLSNPEGQVSELLRSIPPLLNIKSAAKAPVASPRQHPAQIVQTSAQMNQLQCDLLQIWQDVLRNPQLNPDDNFFEVGGHSLLVIQIIARIRSQLGVKLSLEVLFDAPTVRELGAIIQPLLTTSARPCATYSQP